MIRPYEPDDLAQVIEVWSQSASIAHAFLPASYFTAERAAIASTWMPMAETTVFEREGRVDGFCSLIGDELGGLFVRPDAQRAGIGGALVDDARARRARLELTVFEANTIGRRFYIDYGFEEVGREIDEATGEPGLRLRIDGLGR
ncbi:MAG: GNAT family N-acetyltransferase [Actinomycetota bacterium]